MRAKLMCIGVGKYKEKYKSTGLLLDGGKGEFWADIQGNLNWKDYKDKEVEVDIKKDNKGYWKGSLVGGGASSSGEDVRGKCLCQVICAAIASKQIKCEDEQDINYWTDVMMGKQTHQEPVGDDDIPF